MIVARVFILCCFVAWLLRSCLLLIIHFKKNSKHEAVTIFCQLKLLISISRKIVIVDEKKTTSFSLETEKNYLVNCFIVLIIITAAILLLYFQ